MCGSAWQCDHSCDTTCYYLFLFRVRKNWALFKSSMQLSCFVFWENKDWGLFWIAGVPAAANQCCFSYAAVLQSAEGFFLAYIFLLSQDVHSPQGKIRRDRCGIELKNCDAYLNRMVFYWVYSSQSMYTGGSLIWCEACLIWYDCLPRLRWWWTGFLPARDRAVDNLQLP
jgi:hypothetical protein